jgi:hypothetical protein
MFMSLASYFLCNSSFNVLVEACFQNMVGGIIFATIAAELFPLLQSQSLSTSDAIGGVTVGFLIGLGVLNWSKSYIDACVMYLSRKSGMAGTVAANNPGATQRVPTQEADEPNTAQRKKTDISFHDIEEQALSTELRSMRVRGGGLSERDLLSEWAYDPVELSSVAIQVPNHRSHLEEHLLEIHGCVIAMETRAVHLVGNDNLSQRDTEQIAEEIDEAIHSLQYKLDHCRR